MVDSCQEPSTMGVLATKWAIFRDIDRIDCNRRRFEPDAGARAHKGQKARILGVFGSDGARFRRITACLNASGLRTQRPSVGIGR